MWSNTSLLFPFPRIWCNLVFYKCSVLRSFRLRLEAIPLLMPDGCVFPQNTRIRWEHRNTPRTPGLSLYFFVYVIQFLLLSIFLSSILLIVVYFICFFRTHLSFPFLVVFSPLFRILNLQLWASRQYREGGNINQGRKEKEVKEYQEVEENIRKNGSRWRKKRTWGSVYERGDLWERENEEKMKNKNFKKKGWRGEKEKKEDKRRLEISWRRTMKWGNYKKDRGRQKKRKNIMVKKELRI